MSKKHAEAEPTKPTKGWGTVQLQKPVVQVRKNYPPRGNNYPWVATIRVTLSKLAPKKGDYYKPEQLIEQELHCYGETEAEALAAAESAWVRLSAGPPKPGRGSEPLGIKELLWRSGAAVVFQRAQLDKNKSGQNKSDREAKDEAVKAVEGRRGAP